MKLHRKFHRCLNLVVLLALLLLSSPAPSLARREALKLPAKAARPDRAQAAASGSVPVFVNLYDHTPVPATAIGVVGQPVVWVNHGAQDQTITEGQPTFSLYLPLLLRGDGMRATVVRSERQLTTRQTALFDSGLLAPGARFTHTFALTGTFTYYSRYHPGDVVGTIVIMAADETTSEPVSASTGVSLTTPSGVGLAIAPDALLTDTVASISTLSAVPITNSTGSVVGAVHDLSIAGFESVVSGTVTVTLPYDAASLPGGVDESQLRASYFNGRSWIGVPGTVDTERDVIVLTTPHLSWWEVIFPCDEPFGLTTAQELAYDEARDYLDTLADHQDLFEALTTSDGTPLFELQFEEADWLSRQSLCDLNRAGEAGIGEHLHVDLTPQEVADAMVVLGEGLHSQSYTSNAVREMWDVLGTISTGGTATKLGLIVAFGLGPVAVLELSVEFVAHTFFDLLVEPLWDIAWDLSYVGELQRELDNLRSWLKASSTQEVGRSGMNRVPGRQVENNNGSCRIDYQTSKGFYQIWSVGNSFGDEDPVASGFINLYERWGDVYFVLGLQDLQSFKAWNFPKIFDRTDSIIVLLEYEASSETRVARMRLENAKVLPICIIGKMALPDIDAGSEVKVTYYFVERGHLDKRFYTGGVHRPVPTSQPLCYGICSGPSTNHSPHTPSNPSPIDGGIDQSLGVGLQWNGGDPDGDEVFYDVYMDFGTLRLLVCDDATTSSCALDRPLSPNTTYTWQVIARDAHGAIAEGPEWSFTTGAGDTCPITLTLQSPQITDLTATVSGTVTSDCSTITRLNWQWGDGASDDQGFPASHTYAISGTYPITVTAYNDLGDTEVANTTAYVGTAAGEMVLVPAGEFQMGCDDSNPSEDCYSDEQPLHTVYLDAYTIDKYEVTNAQYAEFLNVMGNQEEGGDTWLDADDSDVRIHESGGVWQVDTGYETHPVVEVTWYGARAYCQWRGKRLPTEAEWEKAARGSSDTRMYPWGNEDADCSRLNYNYCVGDTTPVGSYPTGASPYGAMDMAGNVWEWVNDWYDSDYYSTSPYENPPGPASGTRRVLRGGSWHLSWLYARVATRYGIYALSSGYGIGFRCVAGGAPGY